MKAILLVVGLILLSTQAWSSPIVVDANGAFVGFYHWVSTPRTSENAVSRTGYRFSFSRNLGSMRWYEGDVIRIEFVTANCTGQAYVKLDSGIPGYIAPVSNSQPSPAYYVPQDAASSVLPIASFLLPNGTCATQTPVGTGVYPAFPNDPGVTGVQTNWPAPLRVSSSWIFRDGFENQISTRAQT